MDVYASQTDTHTQIHTHMNCVQYRYALLPTSDFEYSVHNSDVDHGQYGSNDDGREGSLWDVVEEWTQQ